MVLQQEGPAPVSQPRAVHDDEGMGGEAAVQVQVAGDLLFARTLFAHDHDGFCRGGNEIQLGFQRAHGAADAEKTVAEQELALRFVIGTDAGVAVGQRKMAGLDAEQVVPVVLHGKHAARNGVQRIANPAVGQVFTAGPDAGDAALQVGQHFLIGVLILREGKNQFLVRIEYQALPGILAEDAAQEQVFVAGAAEGTALGFRLLQGQLDAVFAGCDQQGVQALGPGEAVGHLIADHRLDALGDQLIHGGGRAVGVMHRDDGGLEPEQVAQGMGVFRHRVKAYHGKLIGIVFRQLDGAQHIVDGNADFHHGQAGHGTDPVGGAAPGQDHVVLVGVHPVDDVHAFFQVAGVGVQQKIGEKLRRVDQGNRHGFVRRDGQHADGRFNLNRHSALLPLKFIVALGKAGIKPDICLKSPRLYHIKQERGMGRLLKNETYQKTPRLEKM